MSRFLLPDVGEGLTEAEIVTWRVAVGDHVEINDVLVEIETAKSIVELPSPFAGEVTALLVGEGSTVAVGTAIVEIATADDAGSPEAAEAAEPAQPAVLVGSGPKEERPVRRRKRDTAAPETAPSAAPVPLRSGGTRIPASSLQRTMAAAMVRSAFTVPTATEWVDVDVTAAVELIERMKTSPDFAGVHVTPTLLVAHAVCLAMQHTPAVNWSWEDGPEPALVDPGTVNLGVAVTTERGLVVPNVRDAQKLALPDLARAIDAVIATARAGRTQPAEMSGGTFTLTNVGTFGVDGGAPIVNPGEAAILAVGAIARRPWVVDDAVVPRWITSLTLSFDHRVLDGHTASRFLMDVAGTLRDPGATTTY